MSECAAGEKLQKLRDSFGLSPDICLSEEDAERILNHIDELESSQRLSGLSWVYGLIGTAHTKRDLGEDPVAYIQKQLAEISTEKPTESPFRGRKRLIEVGVQSAPGGLELWDSINAPIELFQEILESGKKLYVTNKRNGKTTEVTEILKWSGVGKTHGFKLKEDIGLKYGDYYELSTDIPSRYTENEKGIAKDAVEQALRLYSPAELIAGFFPEEKGRSFFEAQKYGSFLSKNLDQIKEKAITTLSYLVASQGNVSVQQAAVALAQAMFDYIGTNGLPTEAGAYAFLDFTSAYNEDELYSKIIEFLNWIYTQTGGFEYIGLSLNQVRGLLGTYEDPRDLFEAILEHLIAFDRANSRTPGYQQISPYFAKIGLGAMKTGFKARAEQLLAELPRLRSDLLVACALSMPYKKPSPFSETGERIEGYRTKLNTWKDRVLELLIPAVKASYARFNWPEVEKQINKILDDLPSGSDIVDALENLAKLGYIGIDKDEILRLKRLVGG